jgi:hypothetical protein
MSEKLTLADVVNIRQKVAECLDDLIGIRFTHGAFLELLDIAESVLRDRETQAIADRVTADYAGIVELASYESVATARLELGQDLVKFAVFRIVAENTPPTMDAPDTPHIAGR